ncbi:MAG: DsbA family protein [Pseudomonadota bacterium]
MPLTRRGIMLLSGGVAIAAGVPAVIEQLEPLPDAVPIPDVPGFYRMQTGALSAGNVALVGVGGPSAVKAYQGDPRPALFGSVPTGSVPLAVFTDVNCPNCRVQSATLVKWLENRSQDITVRWHELPLLGPSSLLAARAALAADAQGAHLTMHDRLMQSQFRPSIGYIREMARDLSLNADQLVRDMDSPRVTQQLETSRSLAALFAVPGTPATLVGRTLAVGALTPSQLKRMVRRAANGTA